MASELMAEHAKTVQALLDEALAAEQKSTDEALRLSEQALEIAEKNGFKRAVAESNVRIGRGYWVKGNFKKAIAYLNKGLTLATELEEEYFQTEALIGLGNVYVKMEIYDQATSYYNNAIRLAKKNEFHALEGKILNNLGAMQDDLKNFSVSLDYYKQGLQKAELINDGYAAAIAHFNMGYVYLNQDLLNDAKTYIKKALDYALDHEKVILQAHGYHSLGRLAFKEEAYEESLKHLRTSLKKADLCKDLYIQVLIYIDLGLAYEALKDTEEAKLQFRNAYELAKKIGVEELIPRIHEQKASFYERIKDRKKAHEHYKAYYDTTKVLEEKRLSERVKSVEFQLQLEASLKETETYKNLSDALQKSYEKMHVLSEIGQSMTVKMELSEIFDQLYENVNKIMDARSLGVGLFDEEKQAITFGLYIEAGKRQDVYSLDISNKKSWSVYSFVNNKSLLINDIEKEYKHYIEGVVSTRGEMMHSAMFVPLSVEGDTIGIITVQSKHKGAYSETDKDLLQTLASYLAIAIKNAQRSKELEMLNKRFKRLSEHDGLTGIPNRRLFDDTFNAYFEEARNAEQSLGILLIDIDNFKEYNDTYGHLVGDEVIKVVANHLMGMRQNEKDFVARFGGDEFFMLIPQCTFKALEACAKNIQESIAAMHQGKDANTVLEQITVSVGGLSIVPKKQDTTEAVLKAVDEEHYKIKNNSKNGYSVVEFSHAKN